MRAVSIAFAWALRAAPTFAVDKTAPDNRIIVAHGDDFLINRARDPKSRVEYGPLISALKADRVAFEVGQITMKRLNPTKAPFAMDADFAASGVVGISELQFRRRCARVKP